MNRGYIKLWRSSTESDLYFSEPFTKWQAWSDLLITANHKRRIVNVRGIMVTVEAGSVLAGGDFLASRWKWSRGKVSRFLTYLESETVQQITQHKSNICNVITIVEWDLYQANGTANSTADGQQTVQQTDTPKNVKNVKKKDIVAEAPGIDFERCWKLYNRKGNKQTSLRYWKKLKPEDHVAIEKAIPAYIASNDPQYLKHFQGWINPTNRMWEDAVVVKGEQSTAPKVYPKSVVPDFV